MSPLARFTIIASNNDVSACLYNTTLRWLTPSFRLAPPDCSGPRMAREGASNSLRYPQMPAPGCTPSPGQPSCWQGYCWSWVWSVFSHKWSSTGSVTSESSTCQLYLFPSSLLLQIRDYAGGRNHRRTGLPPGWSSYTGLPAICWSLKDETGH